MKSERDFLLDISRECEYLASASQQFDLEAFLSDETAKRAFARSIEIIGEAVKGLPSALFVEHPEVPWRRMAGMRDRLIHGYFAVDYALVWDVVLHHIPALRTSIAAIIDNKAIQTPDKPTSSV